MQTNQTNETGAEQIRLQEDREGRTPWKKWGPYLSERQWATVREDYSPKGDAWNYFTHDHAQYRAYRWGEDGLAGISDNNQRLCFALALWNGRDPILKERLFGLSNTEGNHGEDVKEYYFYLDSTPTHSYMKYLYKYPQAAYPYQLIIDANRERDKQAAEYELLDTAARFRSAQRTTLLQGRDHPGHRPRIQGRDQSPVTRHQGIGPLPAHRGSEGKPVGPVAAHRPSARSAASTFRGRVRDGFQRAAGRSRRFYEAITPNTLTRDEARVLRQALAGMLWSKQYFYYDVAEWLKVQEIVMEKVAEAVQKKAEEVQQETRLGTEEKKEVL